MYVEKFNNTVQNDELIGGVDVAARVENVSVSGGEFQRGCILAGASGIFAPVTSSADASKVLVISAEDYASTQAGVVSAYTSGDFHAEKVSTGAESVSAAEFKESLRQVGIVLTKLHNA